jgi:hypothetical protein
MKPARQITTTWKGSCTGGIATLAILMFVRPSANAADPNPAPASIVEHASNLVLNNRRAEAQQLLRTAMATNPDDDVAYRALLNVSPASELSSESVSFESAHQRLPSDFAMLQTPRFILLSDADAFAVNTHGRWVERACEEFERFARDCELRPLPLQHKLVCVLFQEHEEYQAFARQNDGMNNPAFTGYYSPRHDRVVFSLRSASQKNRDKKNRDPKPSERLMAGGGRDVLGFESQGSSDAGATKTVGACDEACASNHDMALGSAAKCVHEIIHQLMFHTRIMSPDTQYPLWICEGLSTAFETDSPEQPFGPDHDFAPRRRVFNTMLERGDLIHLRDLVTLTTLSGKNANATRAVYHQSYALVTWLCRQNRHALRSYLQSMRMEPAGRLPASRHLELFEQAFGDVRDVERAWLDWELAREAHSAE